MTGGIIQLIALGNEDIYLTYDPQITFFKMVYKRHTNFSIESVPQNFNSKPDFGKKITCTIGKNADLISQIYVYVTLPKINKFIESVNLPNLNNCAWVENIGWNIISSIEIEIGGYIIDKHYGDWLFIWSELTRKNNNKRSVDIMVGNVPELKNFTNYKDSYSLYIPLYFWFCRDPGLALPIIALEFSDVKINIEFADINDVLILSPTNYIDIDNCIVHFKPGDILYQMNNNIKTLIKFCYFDNSITNRLYYNKISSTSIVSYPNINIKESYRIKSIDDIYSIDVLSTSTEQVHINQQINFEWINTLSITNACLYVDYIYLDIDERIKFIKNNHEYLIDILMYDNERTISSNNSTIRLGYSHPCKELIFRAQMDNLIANNVLQYSNYCLDYDKKTDIITNVRIIMNGTDRLSSRESEYFHLIQSFQHHSNVHIPGVYSYSFSLFPEQHQPSGTCNLSRIDDLQFILTTNKQINYNNTAKVRIYGLCINVLRVINGQCGLAFSN
jgi:hypothetical protein